MASFSTAFIPDWCWDSGRRPDEDDVTISVNLTKNFGLAKRVEQGGWACEGPGQGGEGHIKKIFTPTSLLLG